MGGQSSTNSAKKAMDGGLDEATNPSKRMLREQMKRREGERVSEVREEEEGG